MVYRSPIVPVVLIVALLATFTISVAIGNDRPQPTPTIIHTCFSNDTQDTGAFFGCPDDYKNEVDDI